MRDLQSKSLRLRRYRRRLLLTFVWMSATPVLADPPAAPLDSPAGTLAPIQSNPFFSAADLFPADEIQLASGRNQSTIRLKPIGKAIGLRSLSTPESKPALPQDVSRSKMTIESVPSLIQTNPLIDSTHRADRPLVDVEIMPARAPTDSNRPQRRSTIMLMPSASAASNPEHAPEPPVVETQLTQPIMPATVAEAPVKEAPVQPAPVQSAPVAELLETDPIASPQPQPVAIDQPAREPKTPEFQEPVRFSLTDREQPTAQLADSSDETESTVIEEQVSDVKTNDHGDDVVTSAKEPSAPSIVRAIPAVADPSEPIRLKSAQKSRSSQRETVKLASPTLAHGGVSIVSRRTGVPTQNKLAKRYRPPVEVKSVPLKIERTSTDGSSTASVEVVPAFAPGSVATVGSNGVAPTKLEMDLAQVRSLTLGGKLHTVKVADTSVCKVVASGSHQLKLIGTGEGITQLVVLAEGTESGKKPLQRTFQIHVTDAPQVTGHSLSETCELLNRSVQETFPGCEVLILQRNNQLVVAGRCDSQTSAKKIMRMVRRTCLIPVRDELIVE